MNEIKSSGVAGAILRVLGQSNQGMELNDLGVTIMTPSLRYIPFREFAAPVSLKRSLWFSNVSISLMDGSSVVVADVKRADAIDFVEATNQAWQRSLSDLFDEADQELLMLSQVVERLSTPRRYPSACLLGPYLARANTLFSKIPMMVPEGAISPEQERRLKEVTAFHSNPVRMRDAAISKFVEDELEALHDFFDEIESNPLTPEQRLAVVTDEDATLVLAGAGSGKTSVIVAKAAHLIHRGIRQPSEILLMAFGARAADEMTVRIKERCGAPVDAMTFHALGYRIINEVEGQAPALAPHADDQAQFIALLRDILEQQVAENKELGALLLRWFSEFFWPDRSEWDFETLDEYYQYVEAHELRTLQGELVKSFEELEIANWLYLNGIAYEYEPNYEHKLPDNKRRAYTPDFRLKESGVYIEHFGVRKGKGPGDTVRLTTAPHVDRESYLEGMAWKREVHKENGTTLIETYSYERVEGCLTESLAEKLAPFVEPEPIPSDQVLDKLPELGLIDAFTQTLGTFLRLFKSAGLSVEECRRRGEGFVDARRNLAFLKIFEPVFGQYQLRLGDRIDFEDMIVRATEHVKAGHFRSSYKHLLVDEFQDIADGRAKLLLALKAQHEDARIFAVGDDWQSIYRFSGSDIHLMRNFGQEFGGTFAGSTGVHRTVDLGRTFRSVDKIALPARSFILKNLSQIEKRVISAGTTKAPAITVAFYSRGQEHAALNDVLGATQLKAQGVQLDKPVTVLLLGRYNHVRPKNLPAIQGRYSDLSIQFMTIHASKGLEADHVIILQAVSDRMGLPSEIVDDPVLNMVLPEPEKFDHAEERRLFYVAMTRARLSVSILADQDKPSAFVRELVENDEYGVTSLGGSEIKRIKCASCGGRMLARKTRSDRFRLFCEHGFLCGASLPTCNVCNTDAPVVSNSDPEIMVCSCGAPFPSCPSCEDGWLMERKGRYGAFLGCVNYPDCTGTKQLS
jgi:DNA helicase IV